MSPVDALTYLQQLDLAGFVAMFWHLLIFELPRYLIAAVVTAGAALWGSREQPRLAEPPLVSVLVPTHNDAQGLANTLFSLREQTYQPREIIVINDGSTDATVAVVREFQRAGTVQHFLSTGARAGKAAAANLGLGHSRGEVVVVTDSDTTFDRDALARIVQPFADPRIGAVAGNIAARNPDDSVVTAYQTIQYLNSITLGRRFKAMLGLLFIASGAFSAFRRDALERVGGWGVGPGEDGDLTLSVRRAGWQVAFAPDAWALTQVPSTLGKLVRQRMRWNRSMIRRRLRKFRIVLNPFDARFNLWDAVGTLDILFFQVFISFSFVIYLGWVVWQYGAFAWLILLIVHAVYIATGFVHFVLSASSAGHYARWYLWPYALTYGLFNVFVLRFVRVAAYLDELTFRHSYSDPYVPQKVRDMLERF